MLLSIAESDKSRERGAPPSSQEENPTIRRMM